MKYIVVCKECGGRNVVVKAWVNINTNKYVSEYDEDDTYCDDCKEHVSVEPISIENSRDPGTYDFQ